MMRQVNYQNMPKFDIYNQRGIVTPLKFDMSNFPAAEILRQQHLKNINSVNNNISNNHQILKLPDINQKFELIDEAQKKKTIKDKRERARIRMANARARETSQQRQNRLEKAAQYMRQKRNQQTQLSMAEQRVIKQKNNEAVQRSRNKRRTSNFMLENGIEDYDDSKVKPLHLGQCDQICPHCSAMLWQREVDGSGIKPKFSFCCGNGKFKLTKIPEVPAELKKLYLDTTSENGKYFHKHLRKINCSLAMAWLECDIVKFKSGPQPFKIHGQVHHKIGGLTPKNGKQHAFAQIYILDSEDQLKRRLKLPGITGSNGKYTTQAKTVLTKLQRILSKNNPMVQQITNAYQQAQKSPMKNLSIVLQKDVKNVPNRQYNTPTVAEIAAIVPTNNPNNKFRNIVIPYKRSNKIKFHRIDETHPSYEPLQYVLFYPFGTLSWPCAVEYSKGDAEVKQKAFYKYRLFTRHKEFNILHRGNRLFQQWCVDMYAKVLQWTLCFPRNNQETIRAELYEPLYQAMSKDDIDPSKLGRKVILPASIAYTPRWYNNKYHDAMAIIGKYKKPDLFITFTCNPQWPEIASNLLPTQTALDRPELVDRVFHQKLKDLIEDLKTHDIFGKVIARVFTVEFQKRGLPHAHILIILSSECKLRTADDFDKIVCAELPDKNKEPGLFELVTKFMIHKPCGKGSKQPCMYNGYCKANYPKAFVQFTQSTEDGYPDYRRRSPKHGGFKANIHVSRNKTIKIDNRWVVPYNPYLLQKYQAHINIEICCSIMAVKYLYKYIYKGSDKVNFRVRQRLNSIKNINDEFEMYFDALYISPSEACWKIFGFPLQHDYPNVMQMKVHLPRKQIIYYKGEKSLKDLLRDDDKSKTMLTEWFTANKMERQNPLNASSLGKWNNGDVKPRGPTLKYYEFCEHYKWLSTSKIWKRRIYDLETIGRMPNLTPKAGEIYYLRLVLLHAVGCESWKDLLTYEDKEYHSFKAVCIARGLLQDDREWDRCLTDAARWQTGNQFLALFVTILMNCAPTNPLQLWMKHKNTMGETIKWTLQKKHRNRSFSPQQIENLTLKEIQRRLRIYKKTLQDFSLPLPNKSDDINFELLRELGYDEQKCKKQVDVNVSKMNDQQKEFYDAVVQTIDGYSSQKLFFLDALGGTGKTFIAKTLLSYVRSKKQIAIPVAFSGIAALLLPGGRTVHSRFNLPIEFDETTMGNIKRGTDIAEVLQKTKLFIWDEAPMANKKVLECVHRTLQDVVNSDEPFGGKIIVFSGDYRQILPVLPRASRAQIVASVLNRSPLWQNVHVHHLTENERVKQVGAKTGKTKELQHFADTLQQIGDGTYPIAHQLAPDLIRIPDDWLSKSTNLEEFVQEAFPHMQHNFDDDDFLKGRAILTPKNKDAQEINNIILHKLPDPEVATFISIDENKPSASGFNYNEEVLNSLDPSGLPLHMLQIKKNAMVMLLRNIDPISGACNGTRLKVLRYTKYVIEAKILTGPNQGEKFFIPRITLRSGKTSPIPFNRKQFPIKLSWAMTINKAQGQTLEFMALYLPEPVFAHGQLYVAVGRVGSADKLTIYVVDGKAQGKYAGYKGIYTRNVVFQEVFNHQLPTIDFEADTFRQPQEFEFTFAEEDIYEFNTDETEDHASHDSKHVNSKKGRHVINDKEEMDYSSNEEDAVVDNRSATNSKKHERRTNDKEEMDYSSEEDFDIK